MCGLYFRYWKGVKHKMKRVRNRRTFPKRAGLRGPQTSGHNASDMAPADHIRLRFRELLHEKGVSQSTLCERLEKRTGERWRESRLSKLLNGRIVFVVDDLVLMAECADISLVELFRAKGREFVADLAPSELRVLHAMRDMPRTGQLLIDLVNSLTPEKRKTPRQVIRERMRLGKTED